MQAFSSCRAARVSASRASPGRARAPRWCRPRSRRRPRSARTKPSCSFARETASSWMARSFAHSPARTWRNASSSRSREPLLLAREVEQPLRVEALHVRLHRPLAYLRRHHVDADVLLEQQARQIAQVAAGELGVRRRRCAGEEQEGEEQRPGPVGATWRARISTRPGPRRASNGRQPERRELRLVVRHGQLEAELALEVAEPGPHPGEAALGLRHHQQPVQEGLAHVLADPLDVVRDVAREGEAPRAPPRPRRPRAPPGSPACVRQRPPRRRPGSPGRRQRAPRGAAPARRSPPARGAAGPAAWCSSRAPPGRASGTRAARAPLRAAQRASRPSTWSVWRWEKTTPAPGGGRPEPARRAALDLGRRARPPTRAGAPKASAASRSMPRSTSSRRPSGQASANEGWLIT